MISPSHTVNADEFESRLQKETVQRFEQMRTPAAIGGVLSSLSFVPYEFKMYRPMFGTMLMVRLATVLVFLVIWIYLGRPRSRRAHGITAVLFLFTASLMVSILSTFIGGFRSDYYPAILCILAGGFIVYPLTMREALSFAFLCSIGFAASNVAVSGWSVSVFVPAMYLVILSGFAVMAASFAERNRKKDLEQRMLIEQQTDVIKKARDALWGEMELARKIQTVLLPERPRIEGYEISAKLAPSLEVAGDYYDVFKTGDTDWALIGDVSGHGVEAGLVMMMAQTSIRAILQQNPHLSPKAMLAALNRVLHTNISRVGVGRHMTISALCFGKSGQVTFAGMHLDILIHRAASNTVEAVETEGAWLGVAPDIESMLQDSELTLHSGDTMLLYTDGLTEAVKKDQPIREMFGQPRLMETLLKAAPLSVEKIKDVIFGGLEQFVCDDDVALLLIRRM